MSSANVDAMVREGISAVRAGKKEDARILLMRAVDIDQFNEQAWLWLSAVVESEDEQRICLENVVQINPSNDRAREGLKMLGGGGSNAAPPPKATSTSVEWSAPETETSSPSSYRQVDEPTAEEYDDWVAGLGLSGSSEVRDTSGIFTASPFEDEDAVGPFSTGAASPPASTRSAAPAPSRTADSPRSPGFESASRGRSALEDDDELDELHDFDPEEYFRQIPKDIKVGALPGSGGSSRSPLTIVAVIVLLLLNVGAAVMLAMNFMSSGA